MKTDTKQTFAESLRAHQSRLGATQEQLAGILNISKRALEYWIRGERIPLEITQEGALARLRRRRRP